MSEYKAVPIPTLKDHGYRSLEWQEAARAWMYEASDKLNMFYHNQITQESLLQSCEDQLKEAKFKSEIHLGMYHTKAEAYEQMKEANDIMQDHCIRIEIFDESKKMIKALEGEKLGLEISLKDANRIIEDYKFMYDHGLTKEEYEFYKENWK